MLTILAAGMMASAGPMAAEVGPQRLTPLQLDTVNAGAVAVSAIATAVAVGDSGRTSTQTNTHVKHLANGVVELGFARGKAYACCAPYTDADVVTDSYADGLIVINHSKNFKRSGPGFTKARGMELIVSINPPGLRGR